MGPMLSKPAKLTALRADFEVLSWWNISKFTIFDVEVKHTNAPNYVNNNQHPATVIAKAEKEKKRIYYYTFLSAEKGEWTFTPIAMSSGGMLGNAANRLFTCLAKKTGRKKLGIYQVCISSIVPQGFTIPSRLTFITHSVKNIPTFQITPLHYVYNGAISRALSLLMNILAHNKRRG